jgi:hypothetical protein
MSGSVLVSALTRAGSGFHGASDRGCPGLTTDRRYSFKPYVEPEDIRESDTAFGKCAPEPPRKYIAVHET